jgi:L-amino acid N-acyltransferase YncA
MNVATTTRSTADLQGILDLQKANLKTNISAEEKKEQGFVTMHFNMGMLEKFTGMYPSVIVKDDSRVVGYALMVPLEARSFYPNIESMFVNFDGLKWKGRLLYDYRFYIMGQVCIDKSWRGKGILQDMYQKHRELFSKDFDFMITEVSISNTRSMRAHEKIGFQVIHHHSDEMDDWAMVLWDWR